MVAHKQVSSKLRTSILSSPSIGKVTGTRRIPVPNDAQLERLTQLRIRATERGQRNERIEETFAYAMNHVDIAIATGDNCYQVLMGRRKDFAMSVDDC
ncbi:hypothetical protein N7465_001201 [Penicillium sp. CMV-2018d]|nr:hypothetical protein N7465_001201 [Penicillium sp. CMV-2018d]